MHIKKIEVAPNFSISRIMKGSWQLSQGHSAIGLQHALNDMQTFVDAGITTFDCADIYTGVEELIGQFNLRYQKQFGSSAPIQIFTKFVPDYDALSTISKSYVEKIINRSLLRLKVERLDMVQLSWWNYAIPKWIETAHWLKEFQQTGKIHLLGGTNFNTAATKSIIESGIKLNTLQVQYSLLDHRPEKELIDYCKHGDTFLVCYGTVAGGFLSERWLGQPEPLPPFENRSLIKYKLMIEEFGGWDLFQELLRVLQSIAIKNDVSITNVATRYILQKPRVAAAIIGARNANHLEENRKLFSFTLTNQDEQAIQNVVSKRTGPVGDVFDIERIKDGPHGKIMRYNLNAQ